MALSDALYGVGAEGFAFSLHPLPYSRRYPKRISHAHPPLPSLKREVQLIKQKYLLECPTNELGGYEQVPITDAEVEAIQENQPA